MESSPQVSAMVSNMSGGIVSVGSGNSVVGGVGGGGAVGGAIGVVVTGGMTAAAFNHNNIMNKSVSCKDTVSYKTDHLYCHNNDTSYLRSANITPAPTSTTVTGSDVVAIMKESKQLKAMLLLHLDLIQEQSDQLMSKDKQISKLKQKIGILTAELEEQTALVAAFSRSESNDENESEPIVVKSEIMSPVQSEHVLSENDVVMNSSVDQSVEEPESMELACEESELNSIMHIKPDPCNFEAKSDKIAAIKMEETIYEVPKTIESIETVTSTTKTTEFIEIIPEEPTIPDKQFDTSDLPPNTNSELPPLVPFLSTSQQSPTSMASPSTPSQPSVHKDDAEDHQHPNTTHPNPDLSAGYIITGQTYCTREWMNMSPPPDVDVECNEHFSTSTSDTNANLEIPSWTVKECQAVPTVGGTEDVSDEQFNRRHLRWEHDERRRKKWDVQRIREQRNIERLKRRHIKEVPADDGKEAEGEMRSFYPAVDNIRFIQISDELPVQAFGELIPALSPSYFLLPWHAAASPAGVSLQGSDSAASTFVWAKTTALPARKTTANSTSTNGGGGGGSSTAGGSRSRLRRPSSAVRPKRGKRCRR